MATGENKELDKLIELDDLIGNSGSDETSEIAQADRSITPGADEHLPHLFGTTYIDPEIEPELKFILANAYSDLELEIKGLPLEKMEYSGQYAIATMQLANSINGRNQEVKKGFLSGAIGAVRHRSRGWARRGRGYESNFNED